MKLKTKSTNWYRILMTSMILAMAGMLIAMGVIAIQKSIRVKMSVDFLPGVDVEIYVNDENTLLFRNFEDKSTSKSIEYNATYCTLAATTLTLNTNFTMAYGNNFTLIIKNYSDFAVTTTITATTTAQIGEEQINAVLPEITPATTQIAEDGSQEFEITCDPIIPQKSTITIEFKEFVEEAKYEVFEYGTEGAVPADRAYYAQNAHYKYYIEMGEYPQTGADSATETYLDANYTSLTPDSKGYYTYNGAKYARVASPNTSHSVNSSTNFYKVEPLRWIVVGGLTDTAYDSDPATSATPFNPAKDVTYNSTDKTFTYDGTTYQNVLLVAEQALINTRYDYGDGNRHYKDSPYYPDGWTSDQPWQNTEIYNFLNTSSEGFLNAQANGSSLLETIFTDSQQRQIQSTTLYTGRHSTGGLSGTSPTDPEGTSTGNKLFLLAEGHIYTWYDRYEKENYKVGDYFTDNTAKYGGTEVPNITEYARASGGHYDSDTAATLWWLRSGIDFPTDSWDGAFGVAFFEDVYEFPSSVGTIPVPYDNATVRPSFLFNLAQ